MDEWLVAYSAGALPGAGVVGGGLAFTGIPVFGLIMLSLGVLFLGLILARVAAVGRPDEYPANSASPDG